MMIYTWIYNVGDGSVDPDYELQVGEEVRPTGFGVRVGSDGFYVTEHPTEDTEDHWVAHWECCGDLADAKRKAIERFERRPSDVDP